MNTMKQFTRRAAVATALAMGAWAAATAPANAQEDGHADGPMMLSVDNARTVPIVVYLERGALDMRLGTVPPRTAADQPPERRQGPDLGASRGR
jgi:hypothetical protein